MKLPDANILLYAVDEQSPNHARARDWLEEALNGTETLALAWVVLLAFIRLATHPGLFERPLTPGGAIDLVEEWLQRPASRVVHPGPRHHELLRELLSAVGTAGNLVPDAHLAALAIENNAQVATNDRDFGRFRRVRVTYPLATT